MQGIVVDEEGGTVKAAIVKLYKTQESSCDTEMETITYTSTDENGNFVIQDLDPDEKYVIEIHVEDLTAKKKEDESVPLIAESKIEDRINEEQWEDCIDEEPFENRVDKEERINNTGSNPGECEIREILTGNMVHLDENFEKKLYAIKNTTWW